MKLSLAIAVLIGFVIGWLGSIANYNMQIFDLQKPMDVFKANDAKRLPGDRIKDYSVKAYDNRVVIFIDNPYLARFTDTHSMEPVLGRRSTGLEIVPKSHSEIKEGDIISYQPSDSDDIIIHRVIKTGTDEKGWYAATKGDNNPNLDPEKVRFSQVKRILVGLVY